MRHCMVALVALMLAGCVYTPSGIEPLQGFEPERYMGKWYEIARLDHSFERNLTNVSATYTLRYDGGIDVVNRGFDSRKGICKVAHGRAYFVESRDVARLKVSFFGPFYGGYNVIALDRRDYDYAMVCGPNRKYLWILSRRKVMDEAVFAQLVETAQKMGFNTQGLIRTEHD